MPRFSTARSEPIKLAAGMRAKAKTAAPRLSRQRRPEAMDPADWQRALRSQFGAEQAFALKSLDEQPVFGRWLVHNPASGSSYEVFVRGPDIGSNTCTCADFASNGLGTCKHIEFALHRIARRRGARAALRQGYTAPFSEIWLHNGEPRSIRFRPAADGPRALLALAREHFDEAAGEARWPPDRLLQFDDFVRRAKALAQETGHPLKIADEVLAYVAQARDGRHRREILSAAYPRGIKDKGLAKLLATRLYPYQVEGALFAASNGRVLLGDDMGLGKTVQAIAAAELMARHFGVQRTLVVCPTSLKHQWQQEFHRFARREVQVLQGLRSAREAQWAEDLPCKVINYETLVRDIDRAQAWAPELLIIDEAQRIKNWNTLAARAVRRIAAPSRCAHVFVLTGTPLENRLEELLAIVQVVDQHRLGPVWRVLLEHQSTDDAGRVIGYRDLDRLGAQLAPILLRRRKSEVLAQLPERIDKTLFVPLTPEQRVHHEENGDIVRRIVQRWRKTGYLSDVDQRRLQCALQNMRMVCNSTWLLDRRSDHGLKADELMTLLDELLADPQAKAVVFSQWLGTHEVLIKRLAGRGWDHVFFHGGVPAEQRGALVQRFNDDPQCRLFLSTDAGGTGLNLQHAAAVVVNMDLPWNPAVLEQRIGRVHRMGQRRGVRVINLVAEASIEHGMLGLLGFKRSLFAGVLDGGDSDVFMEGSRLSRFMDGVERATAGMGTAGAGEDPPVGNLEEAGIDAAATSAASAPPLSAPAAAADAWAPVLQAGLQLIEALAAASSGSKASNPARAASAADATGGAAPLVQTDAHTGERYLRLPLPAPDTLRSLAERLLAALGPRS